MSELTIEEKAQRYDEAIERAKKWYNAPNIDKMPTYGSRIIEEIFPEFKECEGEKIRKELLQIAKFGRCAVEYEQKPALNVGPKFKKGEWLVENHPNNYARFLQILEIYNFNGKYNYVVSRDLHNDEDVAECEFIETHWHPFNIKDAKDGDILADNVGVIVFRKIGNKKYADVVDYYCVIDTSGNFEIQEQFDYWGKIIDQQLHPATKEQREILMEALTDAGCEFDFKNKELKKIENEIEIPFGAKDSELQEATYYIPKGFHAEIDDDKVVIKKGEKPAK